MANDVTPDRHHGRDRKYGHADFRRGRGKLATPVEDRGRPRRLADRIADALSGEAPVPGAGMSPRLSGLERHRAAAP